LPQVICPTLTPHAHADTPGQVTQSWRRMKRDLFGDCSDLDAIEKLGRRSRTVPVVGGLTPQQVTGILQIPNRRDSAFSRPQRQSRHI
jgi:hypothetical protein